MAESVIGALRGVLGLDIARWEEGLKKAESGLKGFAKSVGAIAAGIQLERQLTRAVESFVGGLKDAFVQAEKFGEMAEKFGIPVEQLTGLSLAAKLSGVSLEQLGTSLGRLGKGMSEAARGTGPAASAFAALGISVREGVNGPLRSTDAVLLEVAESFKAMQDGAGKTALAIAIFGRAGFEMIPFLNLGREGIAKLTEQAQKMGLVISKDVADAAGKLNDNLTILLSGQNFFNAAVAASVGPLSALAEGLVGVTTQGGLARAAGEALGKAMVALALDVLVSTQRFHEFFVTLRTLYQLMGELQIVRGFEEGWAGINRRFDEGAESIRLFRGTIDDLTMRLELGKIGVDAFGGSLDGAANSAKNAAPIMQSLKDAMVPLGQSRAGEGGLMDENKVARVRREYSLLKEHLEGMRELGDEITKAAMTPLEKIEEQFAKLETARMADVISTETYIKRQQQLAGELQATYGKVFASMAGSVETAFTALAGENKEMLAIAKIAGAAQALINAYVAASAALAQGGIFGIAASASILAAGLAFVAQIRAVDLGGFAQGGSFRVGGAGGIDSQRVMMDVTPGERVDVHKPSNAGNRELVISGMNPKDIFTGDVVRDVVVKIDRWMRDGGTGVKFARAGR